MKALRSFEDLLPVIRRGARIVIHSAAAQPRWLTEQLALWGPSLETVTVDVLMPMEPLPFTALVPDHFTIHAWFPGRGLRNLAPSSGVEHLRYPLSQIPGLYATGVCRPNVLFLHLSPPDRHGCLSLGVAVDYMPAVLATRPLVVAEIDPAMPHTGGSTCLKWDQVDYWVISDTGPVEGLSRAADEKDCMIAQRVAERIPDGATLETGVGAIPDAVLRTLATSPPRNLGIHTGILTDAVLDLIQTGHVTNANKPVYPGKTVATMAVGTKVLYAMLDNSNAIAFHSCDLTHHPRVLAALPRLCAINSALQVDLGGRVNAEHIQGRVIAGPGGLPDFAKAAQASPTGLSIIALRATSRDGTTSNIVPHLPQGAPVTLEPDHVDLVVTEFGAADLRGLSPVRRARALIAVAHPGFRDSLSRSIA